MRVVVADAPGRVVLAARVGGVIRPARTTIVCERYTTVGVDNVGKEMTRG
jgi:hypothetical protein